MLCSFNKKIPHTEWGEKFIASLRREAEKMLDTPINTLSYSEFMRFYETGSRVEYEQLYMAHRKILYHFAAMALFEDDKKWIDGLSDIITAIVGEFAWTFPAHVDKSLSYKELYEHIDLFAAETAGSLSEILYLLSDRLPLHVVDMVKANLKERIIEPYFNVDQRWPKNNWQAVCHGNVAICMMELDLKDEFLRAKDRIVEGLKIFLDSYPEDGICLEGPLYWAYGFGYFVYAAAMLREYTDGEIDLFKSEKVKNIAHFYEYAFVKDEYTVPFADAGHILYLNPGLIGFLHREYSTSLISDNSATKYGYDIRWRLADMIRNFFWSEKFEDKTSRYTEKYFPDAQWYYNRKENYTVCVKGGNNDEPHNHNDIGSLVVFADGKYVIDDLGWPEYDKNYFNKAVRYENYICASSLGHSVPIINGEPQKYGEERRGRVLCAESNLFCVDISEAYGLKEGTAVRTVTCGADSVRIKDELKQNNSLTSRIAVRIKPRVFDDYVMIGNSRITTNIPCAIEVSQKVFETRYSVAVTDMGRYVTAYFVDFKPKDDSSVLELTVEF